MPIASFSLQSTQVIRSWFRYALLALLVLLAAFGVFVYWAGYRVLPQVDGEVAAPLKQAGTVTRDARGIPTITAASLEDALFLQGYATAQDRLFQMDAMRRKAAGELSEVLGPVTQELDVESRRLRLARAAEVHAKTMPPADRMALSAYARGVNHFIRTHRDRLPMEFTLLNYDPKPWTPTDTVLVGLEMYRTLTTTWKHELQKQSLLEGGNPEKVNFLYPPRAGGEIQPGSNAWALSGARTASGKPILANDPHLTWSLPSTWHAVRIQSPDLHVAGTALPGVPGVIIGHNDNIAWGVTNLGYDVQDLYQEHIDTQTLRYEFQGQQLPLQVEREVLKIKGQRPETLDLPVTRHGPVLQLQANLGLSLRWMALEFGAFQFPFLDINRARNWEQFRNALRRFPGPGQNFVYADREGNIGYQAAGLLPIRKNHTGDIPVPGWNGENEWQGVIPFDELPTAFNPPGGVIVTANQNPFPPDYKYLVHGDFSPPYRANQIRALLDAKPQFSAEEMVNIQKDVYSAFSHFLAKQVVAAFDKRKPTNNSLPDAVEILRNWNGQMERGQSAPLIVTFVYQNFKRAVVNLASPRKDEAYQDQMSQAVLERLLRERPKGWFEDWDKQLIQALDSALEEIRTRQGSLPSGWDYGRYNEITITSPVLGRLPLAGEYMSFANIGPIEMSGSSSTVKQTGRNIGPSMRFTADLSDWDRSRLDLTIGESGHLLSPNYKDQWMQYWSGISTPFAFDKPEATHTLRVRPE
jgi:penicillin amidase